MEVNPRPQHSGLMLVRCRRPYRGRFTQRLSTSAGKLRSTCSPHMSRSASEPSELRSCPKSPHQWSNGCSGGLYPAQLWPNLSKIGQHCPNMATLVQLGPTSNWPHVALNLVDDHRPIFATFWHLFAKFGKLLASSWPKSSNAVQHWPKLATSCLNLANLCPKMPNCQCRPTLPMFLQMPTESVNI